ncbi:MAG: undecaprenyldiphospho-muramoylpentapeptide beta-N-acetylglucosaminyltransferase [Bacteroidales bacterium]|nr:undecaprenyldiphospho-muramoylpentapeptide beta-N-acetylglucosaminyltransferase [Bacteroidales bacterium]
MNDSVKIIISGGGTGGHIFPAIAIANSLKKRMADHAVILFTGANGKIEMEKVPEAGYRIIGLNITGIQRSFSLKNILKNLSFPFKLMQSSKHAKRIIREFAPDIVVGVGGFASGPTLRGAIKLHIPTLIQEQNSYPGITNKILSKKADKVCVAYSGMEQYFSPEKIVLTGNPVRRQVIDIEGKREEAIRFFNLNQNKKTLLIVGGSLGAWTINKAIRSGLEEFEKADIQIIWQTGKPYFEQAQEAAKVKQDVHAIQFIKEMDMAYAAADVIVSRAGAIAISELCNVGKPVVFVPYPHAAENHQMRNAMALLEKNAALMIPDAEASEKLVKTVLELFDNSSRMQKLSSNIKLLAISDAGEKIVNEILKLIEKG